MVPIKYTAQSPTAANLQLYLAAETHKVERSINSLVTLLAALNVPVEIGAADSAGVGFRVIRIPN
jgi:hypothetical protein